MTIRQLAMTMSLIPALMGCQSSLDQIRVRGATALGCRFEQVTAEKPDESSYVVSGCGKSVSYVCEDHPEGYVSCREENESAALAAGLLPGIIVGKSDPPAGCTDLGLQVFFGAYETVYMKFKERIALLGGNYGRLDVYGNNKLHGVAFRCPPASSLEQIGVRGATALSCNIDQVKAERPTESGYLVSGCGKSVAYTCRDGQEGYVSCQEADMKALEAAAAELRGLTVVKHDAPAGCTELGPVEVGETAELARASTYDELYAQFKMSVLKLGGNFARLDAQNPKMLRGVAFRCPPPAAPAQ